jgi:hypothetical protein
MSCIGKSQFSWKDLNGLVNLPEMPSEDRSAWLDLLERLPELPTEIRQNVLAPAATYDPKQRNYEIPELYSVFSYDLIVMGLQSLHLGRSTWEFGASQNQRSFTECWSQVTIFAARLGLIPKAECFWTPADRGRNETLVCLAPPSEPDLQISRIRLSS